MQKVETIKDVLDEYLVDLKKWGLFYVPPFSLLIALVFDKYDSPAEFGVGFFFTLFIGEAVFFFSMTSGYLISFIEAVAYELAGKPAPVRSEVFHALRSVAFLVPGLFVAFSSLEVIAPLFGLEFNSPSIGRYKYGVMIGLAAIGVWILYDLYTGKKSSDARIHQLERDHLSAKVAALSAQMNPHLLFNALNTVAATIQENPAAAEEMTIELAGLYRKTLEATRTDFHALSRELDIVRAYLTIEQARFGDRLKFHIKISDINGEKTEIPSLLIQPLVENAVKHGISQLEEGGTVDVGISKQDGMLVITVQDDGIGLGKSTQKGTKTGLENCRSRLNLIYQDRGYLELSSAPGRGTIVSVKLPVRIYTDDNTMSGTES